MITVLVVDDEPDLRLLVRAVLETTGSEFVVVAEASDGLGALKAIRKLDPPAPTVIVLDNRMPGLDGLAVAQRVKDDNPEQIVVLFSAYLNDEIHADAAQIGIDACVGKPDLDRLPVVLRELVDRP